MTGETTRFEDLQAGETYILSYPIYIEAVKTFMEDTIVEFRRLGNGSNLKFSMDAKWWGDATATHVPKPIQDGDWVLDTTIDDIPRRVLKVHEGTAWLDTPAIPLRPVANLVRASEPVSVEPESHALQPAPIRKKIPPSRQREPEPEAPAWDDQPKNIELAGPSEILAPIPESFDRYDR